MKIACDLFAYTNYTQGRQEGGGGGGRRDKTPGARTG